MRPGYPALSGCINHGEGTNHGADLNFQSPKIGKILKTMGSYSEGSPIELMKKLIELTIIEIIPKSTQISGKNIISNDKLRSKIFNILFTNQNCENSHFKNRKLSEFEELSWITYRLSQKHEYDKSHQLLLCIERLQFIDNLQEHSDLPAILHVLLALAKPSTDKSYPFFTPWIIAKQNEKWDLPNAPLNYGDTRLHTLPSWFYVHYPSHLFDDKHLKKYVTGSTEQMVIRSNLDPWVNKVKLGEKPALKRCLGANLNQFWAPNPGTVLFIPQLPDRIGSLELASIFRSCLPTSPGLYMEQEADEGYASSQCSAVGDVSEIAEVYSLSLQKRETPLKTERKFVTESSPEIVKRLWRLNHYHWNILNSHPSTPVWIEKSQIALCKDILYLIIGIESDSFAWIENENVFRIKEGICCKGMTPGAIKGYCDDFIICGNKLRRLEQLCNGSLHKSKGLVWTALIRSVKSFIVIFRAKVLSFNGRLLPMKATFAGLMSKVHFLDAACIHVMQHSSTTPFGLMIINLLLQKMRSSQNHFNSHLILSILKSCCQPFFQFLERWIYHGENYDPFSEFFISSDTATLLFKDNRYWKDGHTLLRFQFDTCEPFIKAVMEQAFACGKTVSFLAAIAENHSLISEGKCNHPKIRFGWSSKQVDIVAKECEEFSSKVKLASESLNEILLNQYDVMCKEKEINLINVAMQQRITTVERIKEAMNAKKESERHRKKLAMEALIQDMRNAKEHKSMQKMAEKSIDDKIMDEIRKMETMDHENAKKMRNEMMSHYEEYVSESDKKELLLKEKLKLQSLHLKRNDYSSSSELTKEPNIYPNMNNFHINAEQENEWKRQGPTRPSCKKTSEASNVSEMSVTHDNTCDWNGVKTTEVVTPINKRNRNNIVAENRRNMMKSRILSGGDTLFSIVPRKKTENISEDAINHNILRNELSHSEQINNTEYINQNIVPHEETGATVLSSPTIPKNDADSQEDSELRDDISLATRESYTSTDDFQLSTTSSMDNIPASSIASEMVLGVMKKSQSENFFRSRGTAERCNKRPKSCLFQTPNTADLPILRDQDEILWSSAKRPVEHFSDKDLLAARNLEETKLPACNASCDLKLCDKLPELDSVLSTTGTSLSDELPSDEAIPTAVNYITRTLSIHVASQSELANKAILSHLLINQGLLKDLNILQSVMLIQNASFCRFLVSNLASKLTPCCHPSSLLTPNELNSAVSDSLSFSALGQHLGDKLFFVVTNVPSWFECPSDLWHCAQLQYKVKWPNSVIVDREAMEKYVKIWTFLTKIHHSVYAIDEVQRSFLQQKGLPSSSNQQFHQLSLMSYEIQNFSRVILSYVSHQVIQTSIANFEKSLRNASLTVDDLYKAHSEYLNVLMVKCFLTENGSMIHNLLLNIFGRVHKFCAMFHVYSLQDEISRSNTFNEAKKMGEEIQKMALFMKKLLQKISIYTRMDHIEAFYLQLNFNHNYKC